MGVVSNTAASFRSENWQTKLDRQTLRAWHISHTATPQRVPVQQASGYEKYFSQSGTFIIRYFRPAMVKCDAVSAITQLILATYRTHTRQAWHYTLTTLPITPVMKLNAPSPRSLSHDKQANDKENIASPIASHPNAHLHGSVACSRACNGCMQMPK